MMDYTATDYGDEDVFQYNVYWRENKFGSFDDWKWKPFATKKRAQEFARKHKIKKNKPYPYITQTITIKRTFRDDIIVEPCTYNYTTFQDCDNYRRIIKY